MRFYHACIALSLTSATAFVPLSQPKRTFVPSTDFAPRTTALYGKSKKNKHEDIITMVDSTVEQAVKLEAGEELVEVSSSVEKQVEVSSSVEKQEEERVIDPQLLIDEERMGKVIDMVQAA
jgi:hypothetical protein